MNYNTWLAMKLCKRYGIPYKLGEGESAIGGVPISKYTSEDLFNLFTGDFKKVVVLT